MSNHAVHDNAHSADEEHLDALAHVLGGRLAVQMRKRYAPDFVQMQSAVVEIDGQPESPDGASDPSRAPATGACFSCATGGAAHEVQNDPHAAEVPIAAANADDAHALWKKGSLDGPPRPKRPRTSDSAQAPHAAPKVLGPT